MKVGPVAILITAVALTVLLVLGGLAGIAFGLAGFLFFGSGGLMPFAFAGILAFGGGLVFAIKVVRPAWRLANEG